MPANPTDAIDTVISHNELTAGGRYLPSNGLTKREMFAMHAMQGIMSNAFSDHTYANWAESIAEEAVKQADALLAELEK